MKQEALLLDRPEDFKHYGVSPFAVEEWDIKCAELMDTAK